MIHLWALHTTHYTLHTTHFTLYTTHYTLHTAHCTLETSQCTLGSGCIPVMCRAWVAALLLASVEYPRLGQVGQVEE